MPSFFFPFQSTQQRSQYEYKKDCSISFATFTQLSFDLSLVVPESESVPSTAGVQRGVCVQLRDSPGAEGSIHQPHDVAGRQRTLPAAGPKPYRQRIVPLGEVAQGGNLMTYSAYTPEFKWR